MEVAPNLAYVWGKYEQNVIAYEEEGFMLSFAYKWLGQKTTKAYSLPDFKGYRSNKHNDRLLVIRLHELMTEADIIVAHNGDKFDIKKSNARFIKYKLTPTPPYKTIDTYKVAKKYFSFNSNKLNDLCNHLDLGSKVSTGGFDLWLGCMNGDMKAWKRMVKYNKKDVTILEKLYVALRPWIANHPHMNIKTLRVKGCSNCGSMNVVNKGIGITFRGKYQRVKCLTCGHWDKKMG